MSEEILSFEKHQTEHDSNGISTSKPMRSKGVSVHFVPARITALEEGSLKGGFWTIVGNEKKIFSSPDELLAFFSELDETIQNNGIWLVMTHPSTYSSEDQEMLYSLEGLCRKKNIILFETRGSELPEGWKQVK